MNIHWPLETFINNAISQKHSVIYKNGLTKVMQSKKMSSEQQPQVSLDTWNQY